MPIGSKYKLYVVPEVGPLEGSTKSMIALEYNAVINYHDGEY